MKLREKLVPSSRSPSFHSTIPFRTRKPLPRYRRMGNCGIVKRRPAPKEK